MENNNQYHPNIQQKLEDGYFFDIGKYLQQALDIMKVGFLPLAFYTLIYFMLVFLLLSVQNQVVALLQMFVMPVLTAGFYFLIQKKSLGYKADASDVMKGFSKILPLTLANILQSIFMTMAFGYLMIFIAKMNPQIPQFQQMEVSPLIQNVLLFLIIPGIYFSVASVFMVLFILFGNMNVLAAMESSRLLVNKQFFKILLFLILLALFNFVGLLAFGFGLLVTIPFTFAAIYSAFKDIVSDFL